MNNFQTEMELLSSVVRVMMANNCHTPTVGSIMKYLRIGELSSDMYKFIGEHVCKCSGCDRMRILKVVTASGLSLNDWESYCSEHIDSFCRNCNKKLYDNENKYCHTCKSAYAREKFQFNSNSNSNSNSNLNLNHGTNYPKIIFKPGTRNINKIKICPVCKVREIRPGIRLNGEPYTHCSKECSIEGNKLF